MTVDYYSPFLSSSVLLSDNWDRYRNGCQKRGKKRGKLLPTTPVLNIFFAIWGKGHVKSTRGIYFLLSKIFAGEIRLLNFACTFRVLIHFLKGGIFISRVEGKIRAAVLSSPFWATKRRDLIFFEAGKFCTCERNLEPRPAPLLMPQMPQLQFYSFFPSFGKASVVLIRNCPPPPSQKPFFLTEEEVQ